MPKNGTLVTFGGAEVLKDQAQHLARSREHVTEYTAPNKVHAWTMQLFYLGRDRQERMSGIQKWVPGTCIPFEVSDRLYQFGRIYRFEF